MKKGWEYKTLGECCDIYNGNSINSDYKMKNFSGRKEGYPFIATKDVSFDGTINYENGIKIPFGTNYKIAFPDSVFICAEGGSAGRKIALVNKKVCFGNKLFCIAPLDNEEFIGKYIYYYMNSALFQNQFKSLLTGLIGGVSAKKFRDILLIKIPLDEQRRIVSYLDSSFKLIDEIKDKALKSLTEAKALFQSALAEAMEPKEGWEEKTLGEICFIARGGSPRPIKNFLTEDESGIPWIKIGDTEIGGKFINCTKEKIKKEGIKSSRFVRKGDFLLSNSMSFGRPYILKTDGCIHDGWLVLQNYKDTFIDDFLYYLLSCNYVQKQFDEYAYGSTVRNLKTDSVSRVSVNYPPLSTQKQIVAHLDNLSSKVKQIEEKYQKMIAECDAMKQAMLREVFE